ncbi:MAG: arylsulfotransferase family protein, partial [Candidatus Neomarinimicrobiota bacterium]
MGSDIVQDGGFYDDAIVKLSPESEILFEKSVSQIFIENNLEYLLFAHGNDYEADPIHLNDIQPVDFDGEFWKKGDVFLSLRSQSMVLLYRPSTNEIIWKGTGPFFNQHDVDIIDNHRISVFNNRSINVVGSTSIVDG